MRTDTADCCASRRLMDERRVEVFDEEKRNAWNSQQCQQYFSEAGSRLQMQLCEMWATIKVADDQNACRTLFTWRRQHEKSLNAMLSENEKKQLFECWLREFVMSRVCQSLSIPCFASLMSFLLSLDSEKFSVENSRFHLTTCSELDDECVRAAN